MKINRIGFFTMTLLSIALTAQSQQPVLTLRQCVDTALKNNIPLQQTGLQADRDKIYWQQAKANMLPNLNGNYDYGWNQGRTIDPFTNIYINQQLESSGLSLSSNVILFSGLMLRNSIRQNHLAYQASKMEWEQAKNNLTLNVLLNYLQVLSNEDLLEISRNQADVTRRQAERLEVMVREGAIGQYQLSDLKGQLANEEINVINNNNALQTAKLNLCQLMNIPYNKDLKLDRTNLDLTASLYALTPDEIYQEALEKFAQVKAADLRVKSAEKAVKVQQGAYYPRLGFGANLNTNYSSAATQSIAGSVTEEETGDYIRVNNTKINVLTEQQNYTAEKISYGSQLKNNVGRFYGFNLQIPLFNNFRTYNQVRLSKLGLKNTELENDRTLLVLRQNIDQAYQNMTATFDRYKALTDQVSNFETSFKAAEIRFNTGVINSVEYLIVKNSLDRARVSLSQAGYEYIFRMRILDFYRGMPVW